MYFGGARHRFPTRLLCIAAVISGVVVPLPVGRGTAAAADDVIVDVGSVKVVEGGDRTRNIAVPVLLSQPSGTTVTVQYRLLAGTATAGSASVIGADFNAAAGAFKTLTFAPGVVARTAVVPIYGDSRNEGPETARVLLSSVAGGASIGRAEGIVTIANDDPVATRKVSVGSVTLTEGDTARRTISVPITLTTRATASVSVKYRILAGTATAGSDFSNNGGLDKTAVFRVDATGYTPVQVDIPVLLYPDAVAEVNETFTVRIVGVTGVAVVGTAIGNITIVDSTETPTAPVTPAAPTIASADAGKIAVSWVAPSSGGGQITTFGISCSSSNGGTLLATTAPGGSSSLVFEGVAVNKEYRCTVAAANLFGWGPTSSLSNSVTVESRTAPDIPGAPSVLSETMGEIAVWWFAPADGGSPITSFAIFCFSGTAPAILSATAPGGSNVFTFEQVQVGADYRCTVAAANQFGGSATSPLSESVIVESGTPPDAPDTPSVSSLAVGQIDVSWTAPSDGGSPITGYGILCISNTGGDAVSATAAGDANSARVSGAADWDSYRCTVVARNFFGDSPESPQSNAVIALTATPPTFTQVGAGGSHSCGLNADHKVVCWGANAYGQATAPSGLFTQVSVGLIHSCGLTLEQSVHCWGNNGWGQATPPSGTFTQVSAGNSHSCGVRTNQAVVCWGYNGYGQTAAPVGTFSQIDTGHVHSCGVRVDQTVACWGYNPNGAATAPPGLFLQISAAEYHSCGIRVDRTILCWGLSNPNSFQYNDPGQLKAPAGQFMHVTTGWAHSCGLRLDRTVACWGDNSSGQLDAPPGSFTELSAGSEHACGLREDELIICWGRNSGAAATAPEGMFAAVSASNMHVCALRIIGSVACWGDNEEGQASASSGTFTQLATGSDYSCGIRIDDEVICWGDTPFGQGDTPSGPFKVLSTGSYHACGLRADQSIVCWGFNNSGQASAPPGTFTQVGAGGIHSCGLTVDHSVVCWGNNSGAQTNAPEGQFMQLDVGINHSCGIRTDQTVTCWGYNGSGQVSAPSGAFIKVSAGDGLSCGIRTDHTVACWGYGISSETDAMPGRFVEVSAGSLNACGLRNDRVIICWEGENGSSIVH